MPPEPATSVTSWIMSLQGPDQFGDGSDAEGEDGDRLASSQPVDGGPDDTQLKGWLPPDDRMWRHPSELSAVPADTWGSAGRGGGTAPAHPAAGPAAPQAVGPPGHRGRHAATAFVGAGAVAAVLVGILLLVNADIGPSATRVATDSVTHSTLTEMTGCCRFVPAVAKGAARAMVSLRVVTEHGVTQDCGVAVAAGGLVATTQDAVADARSITALTAGGRREPARVIATDRSSDIALVRVDFDLPVARFAGDTSVGAGHRAIVMAMTERSGHGKSTATMWTDGTIRSVGDAVTHGAATGMAGIQATAQTMPAMAGEVLLQPDGRVLGILDSTGSPPRDRAKMVFLPAQLVVGVAHSLAASGRVDHGWLDVEGRNSPARSDPTTLRSTARGSGSPVSTTTAVIGPTPRGALIVKVDPDGASANILWPGDIVMGVDGQKVRSMAELRSRLYVLPPGTRVELRVFRGGSTTTVAVDLAASP